MDDAGAGTDYSQAETRHAQPRHGAQGEPMERPDNYEWWVDSIHDSLCQIAGRFDDINPRSNACRHVCDETYLDLSHFVECVLSNGYTDVPAEQWEVIVDLSQEEDLESSTARVKASMVLDSPYFQNRRRWAYGG